MSLGINEILGALNSEIGRLEKLIKVRRALMEVPSFLNKVKAKEKTLKELDSQIADKRDEYADILEDLRNKRSVLEADLSKERKYYVDQKQKIVAELTELKAAAEKAIAAHEAGMLDLEAEYREYQQEAKRQLSEVRHEIESEEKRLVSIKQQIERIKRM